MIRSENLFYEYTLPEDAPKSQTPIKALNGVDLQIANGEFLAILGHNGSGKSTLARHLNALLTPTKGTLWVKGWDTKSPEHLWNIRQTAGMVFQNPDNQLVATIVEEDVAFGPENLGVPSDQIRQRVDTALEAVDMTAYATFAPHHLSGGQKQRVAIAGVLAMRPDCIILDEPTAMLDPAGRKEVLDTVWRLNREEGITVILITHFMEEAVMADRVLVMDKGCVVMNDKPSPIFKQVEAMKALGLDVPPVTALVHELRKRGLPVSDDVLTPEDFFKDEFIRRLAGL